jgi:hypothetical protein
MLAVPVTADSVRLSVSPAGLKRVSQKAAQKRVMPAASLVRTALSQAGLKFSPQKSIDFLFSV